MTTEEFQELLGQIDKLKDTDPVKVCKILDFIASVRISSLQVQQSGALRFLRQVSAMPVATMGRQMKEKEFMKKRCRELISHFGEKRRNSQLKKQGLPVVSDNGGSSNNQNEIDFLLREAEKLIEEKKKKTVVESNDGEEDSDKRATMTSEEVKDEPTTEA